MSDQPLCGRCLLPVDMRQPGVLWMGTSVAHPHASTCVDATRTAAQAWQALRDWCNGTPKQWLREAALARAIERAAGELPEGHMISVHVERGAGWVEATVTCEGGPDMTLAEQVNALVDAALAAGSAR